MILQALYDLYQRLAEDPASGLPKPGYSLQNITFCVVLKPDGTLVEIQDVREEKPEVGKNGKVKKTLRPLSLRVPGQGKPPGKGLNPCFLWDNTGYLLGYKPQDSNPDRTLAAFEAFKKKHLELENSINVLEFSAVCRFLENWNPALAAEHKVLAEVSTGFGLFQIAGEAKYVHHDSGVTTWLTGQASGTSKDSDGFCLVTGLPAKIARLHEPKIKGFDPMGSLLVSFNERAYESFGKSGKEAGQGRNAPVSEEAVFAYCNALNYLLTSRSRRFRIGDATTVFWTEQSSPAEDVFPWLMDGEHETEDSEVKGRLQRVLEKIAIGSLSPDDLGDAKTRFFILGLSPNAARLSVRFWQTGTLGELAANLQKHFEQLCLVRQWDETTKNPDPLVPAAWQLLRQTARDADGIPPLLGGALMRSILLGTDYPAGLITAVHNRIRAERDVTYLKAAILKAWLIRNLCEWLKNQKITMTTALDKENPSVAYQLGRLFAVYEQAQRAAHDFKLDRTIRETMFSSASANPLSVFGRLDRLNKHHLQKLNPGSNRFFSDIIDEIHQKVRAPGFYPASLDLKNQSLFCIGYYHQRHEFRPNKKVESKPSEETAATFLNSLSEVSN